MKISAAGDRRNGMDGNTLAASSPSREFDTPSECSDAPRPPVCFAQNGEDFPGGNPFPEFSGPPLQRDQHEGIFLKWCLRFYLKKKLFLRIIPFPTHSGRAGYPAISLPLLPGLYQGYCIPTCFSPGTRGGKNRTPCGTAWKNREDH